MSEEAQQRQQPRVADPFTPHQPLADFHGEVAERYTTISAPSIAPTAVADAHTPARSDQLPLPRTALCVEARAGLIHIFMPPLYELAHSLELIAAIEHTAGELQCPVVIEGYPPPSDSRLQQLQVTPDPGVIEVNIHPASDWPTLEANTLALYEEARLTRLGTEKFMLDGRHSGTGGGNHVTFGGPTAADSPFLRRPDLLASLISYWQHHPALSYLFAGLFIGPTSQAPRVDEGRQERLYELEIAMQQLPADGSTPPPWLVDRLFRNLLTDLTGNTHRSEFCIDKLYSPDSASGRQGLLEFRAFEMPPHPQMSLAQQLLLRALIARFWATPYRHRLVRWGNALQDRWLLPHYLWADLVQVVEELKRAGYPFDSEWYQPFLAFRFPIYGSVQLGDITLELRAALEPWLVLGEESQSQGTARYVDSSVERLQVRLTGLNSDRYQLACNGRIVPLQSTGVTGEFVAGVRYRAWQPPSALHPTVGIHSPLQFDLIDRWNQRSIGGCSYHVSHPGGRSYDDFPVNANAAETRRHSRFRSDSHTQGIFSPPPPAPAAVRFVPHGAPEGPLAPPVAVPNPDYPTTLDLRLG